jgi:hypothetical protein
MPLLKPILEKGFRDIIENPPKSPIDAANKMAKVYADYVASAIAIPATAAIFKGTEARVMANAIAGGFSPNGAPPAASGGLIAGLTAFWLSPPVIFTPGPGTGPGVATAPTGTGVLQACLASSFTNPKIPAGQAAALIANCLDAFTKLVSVTVPILAPPSVTITFVS